MYFVTIGGMSGYVLFSTTPHGRLAVGVTENGHVRLLAPGDAPREWRVLREWPSSAYSHTDLMLQIAAHEEPERAEDVLAALPAETLG